jgi:hypothetical protein
LILRLFKNVVLTEASIKWDGYVVNAEQVIIWKEMVIT